MYLSLLWCLRNGGGKHHGLLADLHGWQCVSFGKSSGNRFKTVFGKLVLDSIMFED